METLSFWNWFWLAIATAPLFMAGYCYWTAYRINNAPLEGFGGEDLAIYTAVTSARSTAKWLIFAGLAFTAIWYLAVL